MIRSITAGDRAGLFHRASTRTCSPSPGSSTVMICRTATRSSADAFRSSSFSSGEGCSGSTNNTVDALVDQGLERAGEQPVVLPEQQVVIKADVELGRR